MVTIAVTHEVKGEPRVAVSPETVKKLAALGCTVRITSGIGLQSRFADEAYGAAGAAIVADAAATLAGADLLLKVLRPTNEEIAALAPGAMAVAIMSPFDDRPGLDGEDPGDGGAIGPEHLVHGPAERADRRRSQRLDGGRREDDGLR